jgi:hypothetical protein
MTWPLDVLTRCRGAAGSRALPLVAVDNLARGSVDNYNGVSSSATLLPDAIDPGRRDRLWVTADTGSSALDMHDAP